MRSIRAEGFDRRRVRQLLNSVSGDTGRRMEQISAALLGSPYLSNPLIGSADRSEVMTARMTGFDCVTFMESVLALARASKAEQVPGMLREIRYKSGAIAWNSRHHYMTSWIRDNIEAGIVRRVATLGPGIVKHRRLNVVPGYEPLAARFACIPKRRLLHKTQQLSSGDLVFFASTKTNLDVFHCGILIATQRGWFLRHASRQRGQVVEDRLADFLRQNRMSGVIVVRPNGERK